MYDAIEDFGGFGKLHSVTSRPEKLDPRRPPPRPFFSFRSRIALTAISPTTNLVALVGKNKFWVYRTSQPIVLVCYGVLETDRQFKTMVYRYAHAVGTALTSLTTQNLTPQGTLKQSEFSRVALSDTHLVLGMNNRILIFMVEGDHVGQWVYYQTLFANIAKLRFSSDESCSLLLALVKAGAHERAYIFSTTSFPITPPMYEGQTSVLMTPRWTKWEDAIRGPNDVAFSHGADKIGICTSHSMSQAVIRILRKRDNGDWTTWGPAREVTVFSTSDPRDWADEGLTGISL